MHGDQRLGRRELLRGIGGAGLALALIGAFGLGCTSDDDGEAASGFGREQGESSRRRTHARS